MKTLLQNLINIFKVHRDTSLDKVKEYPEDSAFHEGRADAFELAIHILELEEEELEKLEQRKDVKE